MRRVAVTRATFVLVTAFAGLTSRVAAQGGTWALTNARIETVTRGVVRQGTIVIRSGLIEAVGADVAVPPDARVLDLAGRTVLPGFIDLAAMLGLPSPTPPAGGAGAGGGAPATEAGQAAARVFVGLEPERLVVEELRPQASDIRAWREAGVTAALVAPSRGTFRGQSVLVPLRDSVTARDALKTPVAMHLGFQGVQGRYPSTAMGVQAYQRQRLYDARRYGTLVERYRANPRGMERPAYDAGLAALVPVVRGELPVFYAATSENEIRRAAAIGRELGLLLSVVGAGEGFRVTDALASLRRPVVVSLDLPRAPDVTGWSYRGAQRRPAGDSAAADSAVRRILEGNAAALQRAGIPVVLASGGVRAADFLGGVRKAIAAGLPRDSALVALTLRPAQLAGMGEQLGAVEAGRIANLVVTEGDLFTDSGTVRAVFVDGIRYTVEAPPPRPPAGRGGAEPAARVEGTWDLTITTPQGPQAVTMTLQQSGAAFTGTMTSQVGGADVANGRLEGTTATWTITLAIGGQSMELSYTAEIEGTRMRGTVTVGPMGSFPFTGEKRP